MRDCEALSPDQRADYLDKKAEEGLESAHNAAAAADQEGGEGATAVKEIKAPREALASESDIEKMNRLFGMSSADK